MTQTIMTDEAEICMSCGMLIEDSGAPTVDGERYCLSCYMRDFAVCRQCGRPVAKEDELDGHCPACYPYAHTSLDGDGEKIMMGMQRLYDEEAVAVELECNPTTHVSLSNVSDRWIRSIDRSVSSGNELKMMPIQVKKFRQFIRGEKWLRFFSVDESCGTHIHINMHPYCHLIERDYFHLRCEKTIAPDADIALLGNAVRRLLIGYKQIEEWMARTQPASRINGRWCSRITTDVELLKRVSDEEAIRRLTGNPNVTLHTIIHRYGAIVGNRYQWVNIDALPKYNTVEIRLHKGTVDPEEIANWVEMHAKIVRYLMLAEFEDVLRFNENKLREVIGEKLWQYYTKRQMHYTRRQMHSA